MSQQEPIVSDQSLLEEQLELVWLEERLQLQLFSLLQLNVILSFLLPVLPHI